MLEEVSDGDFDVEALERSHEIPVPVGFWAEWCGRLALDHELTDPYQRKLQIHT